MIALLRIIAGFQYGTRRVHCNSWSSKMLKVSWAGGRKKQITVTLVASVAVLFSTAAVAQRGGRPIEIVRPHEGGLHGPSLRSQPRDFQLNRLNEEIQKSDPNPRTLEEIVRSSSSESPGQYLGWISQAIRKNSSGTRDEPIDQSSPNVLLRRPADSKFDPLVSFLKTNQLDSFLNRSLNRSGTKLLSFVFSTSGRARISEKIPLQNQVRGQHLDKVKSGEFNSLDANMFASLRGETVIAIGHIVRTPRGNAFEVKRDSGQPPNYVELQSLERAAQIHGFDFVPLGCETAESAAVGTVTKITDLNAIEGVARVIAKDGAASWREVLADLSSPDLKLAIDITKITEPKKIPIEYVDRDSKTYQPGVSPAASNPRTPDSTGQIVAKEGELPSKACLVSEDWLRRSQEYDASYSMAVYTWWTGVLLLTLLAMLAALIDCIRLRPIPPAARVRYFAIHSCFAAAALGLVYLTAYGPSDFAMVGWLLFVGALLAGTQEDNGFGCLVVLIVLPPIAVFVFFGLRTGTDIGPLGWSIGLTMLGALWGVFLASRPDYWLAKCSSIAVLVCGLFPWLSTITVMVLRGNCWLVDVVPL